MGQAVELNQGFVTVVMSQHIVAHTQELRRSVLVGFFVEGCNRQNVNDATKDSLPVECSTTAGLTADGYEKLAACLYASIARLCAHTYW